MSDDGGCGSRHEPENQRLEPADPWTLSNGSSLKLAGKKCAPFRFARNYAHGGRGGT